MRPSIAAIAVAISLVSFAPRSSTAQAPDPLAGAVIAGLAIVFDEGTDQGTGVVHLDNITVEVDGVPVTWTFAGDNGSSALTLHPSGFGPHARASWRGREGQGDSRGNAHQALRFEKDTATATFAAGIAVVSGIEGTPITALTGLSWEHRADGHCGAGAPRWNITVLETDGHQTTLFFGCAGMVHTPGSEAGWIRDTVAAPALIAAVQKVREAAAIRNPGGSAP